ncbi:MAG: hypothetical protein HQL56_13480 [Magnetococcales bacterium]|nr:hypothetical protein [Magnetococcales bacterium]
MKRLGSLDLPPGIQWTDRFSWSPVAQETARTLGGRQVVWHQPLAGGRPVTLELQRGYGLATVAARDALLAMAAQPGAVFILEWDGESHQVMFRHHESPACRFEPLWPGHDHYAGEIRLMTV